jgi:hypothetical protein
LRRCSRSGYRGDLKGIFHSLFVLIHVGAIAAFAVMLFRPKIRDGFERRCVGTATAIDLAYVRVVTCAVLIVYVLSEDLASQAGFGTDWFAPPGYTSWLGRGWLDWFLSSSIRLHALTWLLVGALLLGMVGFATRITLPLAAVLYLVFAALLRSFGKYFHEGYLGFYVLIVLCFLPCADAWSLDARRRGDRPAPIASYAWGVYACFAAASIPYLQLGLSKLIGGGLFWFDGRSMRNYMLVDDLNIQEWNFDLAIRLHEAPTAFFTIIGLVGLLIEVCYALVLVAPRLRTILPACVAMLHVGIWLGQDLIFVDAILIPLIFFTPGRWPSRWR